MPPMPGRDRTVDPVHDLRWVLAGLVVLVVAVLVVQAGCNTGPETRIEDGEVRLDLSEYSITPRNLVMPAGRLVVDARNTGRLVHSGLGTGDKRERERCNNGGGVVSREVSVCAHRGPVLGGGGGDVQRGRGTARTAPLFRQTP